MPNPIHQACTVSNPWAWGALIGLTHTCMMNIPNDHVFKGKEETNCTKMYTCIQRMEINALLWYLFLCIHSGIMLQKKLD